MKRRRSSGQRGWSGLQGGLTTGVIVPGSHHQTRRNSRALEKGEYLTHSRLYGLQLVTTRL
jgi:hypothetical protein